VASDVDGVREAIVDGVTGRLCRYNDTVDWNQTLHALALDSTQRQQMAMAATARYAEQFSLAAMATGTLAVYRQLLARTAREQSARAGGA